MQKWQYTKFFHNHITEGISEDFTRIDDNNMFEKLNELGGQGWESYAVIRENNKTIYYLKRPIE